MKIEEAFGSPRQERPRANPVAQAEPAQETALLTTRQQEKLDLFAGELRSIMATVTTAPLETAEQAVRLTELASRAKVAFKELEECRHSATDHLRHKVETINRLFGVVTLPLLDLEARAKQLLLAWNQHERARVQQERLAVQQRQEEAARKEAAAVAQLAEAKSEEERMAALAAASAASHEQMVATVEAPREAPRGIRTDTGTASVAETWAFEVIKPEDVPRIYCAVDDKLIRKAVREGVREIAGVSIFQREGMSLRVGGRS